MAVDVGGEGDAATVVGSIAGGAGEGAAAVGEEQEENHPTGSLGMAQLEELLRKQGHRTRVTADGRLIVEPAPKPNKSGGEATMGRLLSKLKVVTPLMKALEFSPQL